MKNKYSEENITVDDNSINVSEMIRTVWDGRKPIILSVIAAAVVGLIVAVSIPKEYTTFVSIAPEVDVKRSGMSNLAALSGLNVGGNSGNEALSPMIYPNIVRSTPFIMDLWNVPVSTLDGEITTTYYNYIKNNTRSPWWSSIVALPGNTVGWIKSLFSSDNEDHSPSEPNPFRLSRDQYQTMRAIRESIGGDMDVKTGMASLSVTAQDPLVAAIIADTMTRNLQRYITDYRTDKARKDMIFAEQLYEEAKIEYTDAQKKYAKFVDRNQNIVLQSYRSEEERLRNEMNLAFNLYNQSALNLSNAKAKVQEITPVFTIVEPASVTRLSKPSRAMILVAFAFLGFLFSTAWVLWGDDIKGIFRTDRPGFEDDK